MRLAPSTGIMFETLQTKQEFAFGRWIRYGQSKLANILYGAEIARRYPTISVAIVHPGVIMTDLVTSLGFADRLLVTLTTIGQVLTPEQGVHNQLWAATVNKKALQSGAFYERVGLIGKPSKYSQDEKLANELFEWTQSQLEGHNL
jgi:NAD(P)-dependent dehydrogenase (short-subunit alcohol dehydrogenase family)